MDTVKKDATSKPKADTYNGLHNSTQTFGGIGCLQAINGNIVLRGRKGQRDHIFQLQKAVQKYHDTMDLVHRYALYGVKGWDTLKDIADDFRARIYQAVNQRRSLEMPIPKEVQDFIELPNAK